MEDLWQAFPPRREAVADNIHSPGQMPLGMNSHVYEQRAEDEQVGAVINGIFDQRCFDLPSDGETSGAGIRLHEGQQQPDRTSRTSLTYTRLFMG